MNGGQRRPDGIPVNLQMSEEYHAPLMETDHPGLETDSADRAFKSGRQACYDGNRPKTPPGMALEDQHAWHLGYEWQEKHGKLPKMKERTVRGVRFVSPANGDEWTPATSARGRDSIARARKA